MWYRSSYLNTESIQYCFKNHSLSDMEITIIEKLFIGDPQFRKQREKMYIQKCNTKYRGLNKMNGG